jgi:hypothetical protein
VWTQHQQGVQECFFRLDGTLRLAAPRPLPHVWCSTGGTGGRACVCVHAGMQVLTCPVRNRCKRRNAQRQHRKADEIRRHRRMRRLRCARVQLAVYTLHVTQCNIYITSPAYAHQYSTQHSTYIDVTTIHCKAQIIHRLHGPLLCM